MGDGHPTGMRITRYIRDSNDNLAETALRESIEGLETLVEMDADSADAIAQITPEKTKGEDREDLDKYKMLLEALVKLRAAKSN